MAISISRTKDDEIIREPYIGPRPFDMSLGDQKRFFGRDYETDEIMSLIYAHNLVLVYAQSGAGKTSIFNAQILPTLKKRGFEILPTARVKMTSTIPTESSSVSNNSSRSNVVNIYMFNALRSMLPKVDPYSIVNESLTHFLTKYFPVKKDKRGRSIPQVILFDQFEELFTLFTKDYYNQQKKFLEQIVEALDNNPVLRIVFVMREEYIAQLDPFTDLLPERLRYRFRLEGLKKQAALTAIKGPLQVSSLDLQMSNIKEINKQTEELVNDLLKIRVEDPVTGKPQEVLGEFVEPIQLQVVCRMWWQEKLSPKKTDSQTHIQLEKSLTNVDRALGEFYEEALRRAVSNTGISDDTIRAWFDEKFITASGTRAFVHHGAFIQGINNVKYKETIEQAIDALEKSYIIRAEWRSGAKWYELTHDRLIGPIRDSNEKEARKINVRLRKSLRKKLYYPLATHKSTIVIVVAATVIIAMIVFYYPFNDIDSGGILLGRTPSDISVNPQTNMVYVSTSDNNPISVIDGKTNEVVDDITLDQPASDITVNPQTNMIYAAGYNSSSRSSDSIYVIDGNTKTMVFDISVDKNIIDLSVNPETNMIYAVGTNSSSSSRSSDSVYAIDGKTNEVVDEIILLNKSGSYIAVNPQTNMIYAAGYNSSSRSSDSISVIDGKTNKVVGDITLDQPASDITVNPQTNMIYAAGYDFVYVIDGKTNKVVGDITLDQPASDITVNPQTNMIYAAVSDSIYVIDATAMTMVVDISVDENILYLSVNPETNMIYVSDFDSNTVYTINGIVNRIEAIVAGPEPPGIQVGREPSEISVNPQTNMVYVSVPDNNAISVIDGKTNKVVDTIRVNKPSDITVNPQTNMIYVAGYNSSTFSDSVSIIDGKTNEVVVGDITLDQPASDITVNPQTNMIYVAGHDLGFVYVIDGKTNEVVVGDITLDQPASDITVNPQTNMIYVVGTNSSTFSDSVSIIDGKTNKVVDEIILLNKIGSFISVNPQTNMIYVVGTNSSTFSDSVSIIDGKTNEVVDDITLDQPASDITVNPQTNMIYVAGSGYISSYGIGSGSVSVIDGRTNKVVDNITLNHVASSEYIEVNPKTNIVYIASSTSDSVSVIDGTTHQIITDQ